jgi:hypothetical protein
MVEFKGPEVNLGLSPADLQAQVADLNNLGSLLPSDAVKDFQAKQDSCSFKVTGGVSIHLVRDTGALGDNVILKLNTVAPTPVKFNLVVVATACDGGATCYVRSEADLNPFTRMMVEPALKDLFENMAKGLVVKFPIV